MWSLQTSNSSSSASSEANKKTNTLKSGLTLEPRAGHVASLEEKEGIEVELVEFTDYVQPKLSVRNGTLIWNFFQQLFYFRETLQQRTRNTHQPIWLHWLLQWVFTLRK